MTPSNPKRSAGILLYRRVGNDLEVLIAHPGGPLWARKDDGAWSIPKGLPEPGESAWQTARREFAEETGTALPDGEHLDLGEVQLKSGKVVTGFAVESDFEPDSLHSNTFEMIWPPRSGRLQEFPEIDRAQWCAPGAAKRKLNPAQGVFVDRLLDALGFQSSR